MIDRLEDNVELLVLTLLRLRDLRHVQLLAGELLPEFVQHLAVVHVLLQLLDDDALLGQLVVDPVDKNALQLDHLGLVDGLRIDDGALLVLACKDFKDNFGLCGSRCRCKCTYAGRSPRAGYHTGWAIRASRWRTCPPPGLSSLQEGANNRGSEGGRLTTMTTQGRTTHTHTHDRIQLFVCLCASPVTQCSDLAAHPHICSQKRSRNVHRGVSGSLFGHIPVAGGTTVTLGQTHRPCRPGIEPFWALEEQQRSTNLRGCRVCVPGC